MSQNSPNASARENRRPGPLGLIIANILISTMTNKINRLREALGRRVARYWCLKNQAKAVDNRPQVDNLPHMAPVFSCAVAARRAQGRPGDLRILQLFRSSVGELCASVLEN